MCLGGEDGKELAWNLETMGSETESTQVRVGHRVVDLAYADSEIRMTQLWQVAWRG